MTEPTVTRTTYNESVARTRRAIREEQAAQAAQRRSEAVERVTAKALGEEPEPKVETDREKVDAMRARLNPERLADTDDDTDDDEGADFDPATATVEEMRRHLAK